MCDYSLEMYKSRPAVEGEDLELRRFASGSAGFVIATDPDCAVCCKSGVEVTLELNGDYSTTVIGSSDTLSEEHHGEVMATFFTISGAYLYRDGFVMPSGRFLSVQNLKPGTKATVTKALPEELTQAVASPAAFDPDVKTTESAPALVD